jgi:uroporphyrinogen-III synthase
MEAGVCIPPERFLMSALNHTVTIPENAGITLLHGVATRIAAAELHDVLAEVVSFVTTIVRCDSCFLYVLKGEDLVLRSSKNPHPEAVDRLKLKIGQGITGWVAKYCEPVAVASNASRDPRFQLFNELPEDRFESFLSVPLFSRGRLVGVINLQNREAHEYSQHEMRMISTLGFLVGAEVELARLEGENSQLSKQLELKISEQAAYAMLQRQSQERRKSMRDIADAIVLTYSVKSGLSQAVK